MTNSAIDRNHERTRLVKLITAEAAEQENMLAKCAEFDAQIEEIKKGLLILEKQKSPAAVQLNPALASWNAERLAATIASLPPDELAKLRQS